MNSVYQIGHLATLTGVGVETIRYYEAQKLLPKAARTQSNYRRYDDSHVERLSFIRHCRSLDMSIDEIRQLLRIKDKPEASCAEVNVLLDQHIDHVTARLKELRRLERELRALRARCQVAETGKNCGILSGLSVGSVPSTRRAEVKHPARAHARHSR